MHSVENVGKGHPMGAISAHFMNGPKSDVPKPAPWVIASAIALPNPLVPVDPALPPVMPVTTSTMELPSPASVVVALVLAMMPPISGMRSNTLDPVGGFTLGVVLPTDAAAESRTRTNVSKISRRSGIVPTFGTDGVVEETSACDGADCSNHAARTTKRNAITLARLPYEIIFIQIQR